METAFNQPSSIIAGLRCVCPRCGEGKLLRGFLTVAPSCDRCGLDYSFADPADGPAFFGMSLVGILVMAAWAIWVVMAHPPIWVQMVVVFPTMLGGCLAVLRPLKGWLVAEQYVHKAEEGRWESIGRHGEGRFAIDRREASAEPRS